MAEHVRRLRHHGDTGRYHHVELGYCSRLDEMQAAMLRVKLRQLEAWNVARRQLAARYRTLLAGLPLGLPYEHPRAQPIYHQFVVRHPRRDAFAKALADLGVGTMVHYPLPVPGQPLFGLDGEKRWPHSWRAAREVLSLPCYPEMTDDGSGRRGRRGSHRARARVTRAPLRLRRSVVSRTGGVEGRGGGAWAAGARHHGEPSSPLRA